MFLCCMGPKTRHFQIGQLRLCNVRQRVCYPKTHNQVVSADISGYFAKFILHLEWWGTDNSNSCEHCHLLSPSQPELEVRSDDGGVDHGFCNPLLLISILILQLIDVATMQKCVMSLARCAYG
jgi:hypothetical protein